MEVEKRITVNGGMKLPIGYRFHPTEQELILHYLLPKAFASPLPSSIIPVFDVFFSHPLTFPGDQTEKQRYFFCNKRKEVSSNEHRIKISSGDGYWKPIGKARQIIACGKTIGIRRTLAFYETNKLSSTYCNKTRWSMTEYCLPGFAKVMREWAVYNVYERKGSKERKQRKSREKHYEELSCSIHFIVGSDNETGPPPPSPPTSADE